MPSKNIAAVLNNESNLRILDKLKQRPFYPRELSAEMGLSEPFIVRRLKAMEEYDIVEGRWESENGRKVKRYYVKDVTMQLGKDGLQVTSGEAPVKSGIDLRKELTKSLIYLPIIVFIACGYIFEQPIILGITCLLFAWQLAVNLAFYRTYRYNTMLTAALLLAAGVASTLILLGLHFYHFNLLIQPSEYIGLLFAGIGFVFFMTLIYHVRFSQAESRDLMADKKELMASLESSSLPVKVFYLPLVLRWKLNEYFGLV